MRREGLFCGENCGAEGDRTPDLLHAMQALSQLSYSPRILNSTEKHSRCGTSKILSGERRAL